MLHKLIAINDTAYIEMYVPDPTISYNVTKKWPAVVICPGGGYMISAIKEGEAVAMQFLAQGYACFVLRYSTFIKNREAYYNSRAEINDSAYYPKQLLELMETLHLVTKNSEEWFIDLNNIFTIGFSAGAHIVAMEALRWQDNELLKDLSFKPKGTELKPKGSILCYPMLNGVTDNQIPSALSTYQRDVMNQCLYKNIHPTSAQIEVLNVENYVTSETSEMFIWHTTEDTVTHAVETTSFVLKLQQLGVPCDYHLFKMGRHGLACANKQYAKEASDINSTVSMWLPLVLNWMGDIIE